jgi:hypothetical protein
MYEQDRLWTTWFQEGAAIGLAASVFSISFLCLPFYGGTKEGTRLGALHDSANKYFFALAVIQFVLFVACQAQFC